MRKLTIFLMLLMLSIVANAQNDRKPRVFIKDSQSWEVRGGTVGLDDGFGGEIMGGARPQTAEIIKTFNKRCPGVTVTMKESRADYVVVLEHEGGKDLVRRDNKFAVSNADGDIIRSGSTRSLGNAVKDACEAIMTAESRN